MWSKVVKALLAILLFVIILSKISNTFDGDLGWHLRFGSDAFNSNFQYHDSYTWPFFGQEWTNHEWGGDLVFWWMYANLGYFSLVLLVTSALFAAFYFATKIANGQTTISGLVVAIFAAQASSQIFVMRLAMLAPLFFIIVWYSLRKIPDKRCYYFWPLLFWVWSALHGSWVFGFIVINIYVAGNIGQIILHRFRPEFQSSSWRRVDFIKIIGAQILSLLAIALNPYGFKILSEVSSYFSQAFFKSHITEWVPSYTYPVFWASLAWSTVALFLALVLAYRKKVALTDVLLVVALFISGFQYKRNVIFILLVGIPLIAAVADYVLFELSKIKSISQSLQYKAPKVMALVCSFTAIVSLFFFFGIKIKIFNDIWSRRDILWATVMPYDATEFLKKKIGDRPVNIFNEFNWGGYLNWKLPNALVYLDGRGTATWINPKNPKETMLESYFARQYDKGGLKKIEDEEVKYIFLRNWRVPRFGKPDWINKIIFREDLEEIAKPEMTELNKELENSNNWQLIYSDGMANIWERR